MDAFLHMIIPDDVSFLVQAEQLRHKGSFIAHDPSYFDKLSKNAELLMHYLPEGLGGFVFFYCNDPEKKNSYISLICTDSQSRNRGIGSALIGQVLLISKMRGFGCCQLEVSKDNTAALRLYEKFGFEMQEDRDSKFLMVTSIV